MYPVKTSVVDHAYVEINDQWVSVVTGARLRSDTKIVMLPPKVRIEYNNGVIADITPSRRPQTFVPTP
jgi:hypothetical protein